MVFGLETVNTTTLTIRGGPDASGDISLFIGPVYEVTKSANLFITGPKSAEIPLFIGLPLSDGVASGKMPIYMNGQPNYGGTPIAKPLSMRVRGIPNTVIGTNATLTMRGPAYIEEKNFTTLFITRPAPPEIPQGGSTSPLDIGAISLIGVINISGYAASNKGISLAIRGDQSHNTNTTLYIETDFNKGKDIPLFIKQTNPNQSMTMFASGRSLTTNSATLFIKTPIVKTTTLFEIGYQ
jgi:hypothetical protein